MIRQPEYRRPGPLPGGPVTRIESDVRVQGPSWAAVAAVAAIAAPGLAAAQGVSYRPLTVAPHYAPRYAPAPGPHYYYGAPATPSYDPYRGPGAIVTGPVHVAGTVASAPFRAINSVFPARGDTPLVLIGGPIYLAGRLVEFPFRVAESAFGGPNPFRD